MSGLSDIVAATREEADAIDLASPEPLADAVLANSVDPVKLGQLEGILTGATFTEILGDITAGYRRSVDDETWLVGIRPQLVDALAAFGSTQASDLAARWASTDEWRLDGGTAQDLEPLVSALIRLAGEARVAGRDLYLLMRP
jgi:hypothetical protein